MNFAKSWIIFGLFAVAVAAPSRRIRSVTNVSPPWYQPCGQIIEQSTDEISQEELERAIKYLKLQHQITLQEYLDHDYEYLYDSIKYGVRHHQYIPNWIPGKKDTNFIRMFGKANTETIVDLLPKLHTDLQKFAVAFEELVQDDTDLKTRVALKATQSHILMLLCEVEDNIAVIPSLSLPERIERSIMSRIERDPIDDTRRIIRDWGVLLRYKDYLHAWRRVFDN